VRTRSSYDYALVRVVPRVERAEFINAGALVHCRDRRYLGSRVELDRQRLLAVWPGLLPTELDEIEQHLRSFVAVAEGGAAAGPLGRLPPTDRFHWLVAPRSTIVQTSPVHAGLCDDPEAALADLVERLVMTPRTTGV
jgi:hypothetical protein